MEEYTLNLSKEEMEVMRRAIWELEYVMGNHALAYNTEGRIDMLDYVSENLRKIADIKQKIRNTGMRV